jgi:hypothetical protein
MTLLAVEQWEKAQELRKELKEEWSELWKTKLRDQVIAEKMSSKDYERLFVEKGEVIYATRRFKLLSFREILEKNLGSETADKVSPDPSVGGWRKFAREHIDSLPQKKRLRPTIEADLSQQQRKGGTGWLNKSRIWRKVKLEEQD